MSKMREYIEAACGYDANGLPSSIVQFTFGTSPFITAQEEDIENTVQITKYIQSECIVDIQVIDSIAAVSFDFSLDTEALVELVNELDFYRQQILHVSDTAQNYQDELTLAERNGDEKAVEDVLLKMRALTIPFMQPTIVPAAFGGTVNISFEGDPKFTLYTADQLNQMPYKVIMIFDASEIFAQDEIQVYSYDEEAEILQQQQEMFLMDEARRAEEAAYQAQYGYSNNLYDDGYDDYSGDSRMKGVRFK